MKKAKKVKKKPLAFSAVKSNAAFEETRLKQRLLNLSCVSLVSLRPMSLECIARINEVLDEFGVDKACTFCRKKTNANL